jgi:hypothetical protein
MDVHFDSCCRKTIHLLPEHVFRARDLYNLVPMSDYPDDPTPEVRDRREKLFALFKNRRYNEAADYALTLDESVTIFSPIEAIAARIRKQRPADARRLYLAALAGAREYASWATGGGEGLSRMVAVHDLEAKLALGDRQSLDPSPTTGRLSRHRRSGRRRSC